MSTQERGYATEEQQNHDRMTRRVFLDAVGYIGLLHEIEQCADEDELAALRSRIVDVFDYDPNNHADRPEDTADYIRTFIQEEGLSIEFRSGWTSRPPFEAEEFRYVLGTGGPHLELVGHLTYAGEPDTSKPITARAYGWFGANLSELTLNVFAAQQASALAESEGIDVITPTMDRITADFAEYLSIVGISAELFD